MSRQQQQYQQYGLCGSKQECIDDDGGSKAKGILILVWFVGRMGYVYGISNAVQHVHYHMNAKLK